ncbi:hypothetical protein HI914_00268 [Erysiphe necator]|nr:hypothetical protein HI914_00268 [Erysiphe necator]
MSSLETNTLIEYFENQTFSSISKIIENKIIKLNLIRRQSRTYHMTEHALAKRTEAARLSRDQKIREGFAVQSHRGDDDLRKMTRKEKPKECSGMAKYGHSIKQQMTHYICALP